MILLTAALAAGVDLPTSPSAEVAGLVQHAAESSVAHVELEGPPGADFILVTTSPGAPFGGDESVPTFVGQFDPAGRAFVAVGVSDALAESEDERVDVNAVIVQNGVALLTPTVELLLGSDSDSILLDFDFAPGPDEPVPGQIIDTEYNELGLSVSADNLGGGPDLAITFDSGNPTGGDTDLATPGPGMGNDTALGQLLIVAESGGDANGDGNVDVPDDELGGGVLAFDFALPTELTSMTVIDVDDQMPSFVRVFLAGEGDPVELQLADVGNNGVQTLSLNYEEVVRLEVEFGGSGGIADLGILPCPLTLDFNETPAGRPLDLEAGAVVTDQLAELGVTISADADNPAAPDKAIIFDSANPSPADPDLATPGPGENNDEPLGNLLIIAENDVDADNDGLVDVPDDALEGGLISLQFDDPVTVFGFTVVDVDSMEQDLVLLFDEDDNLLLSADLGPLGNNSVASFDAPFGVEGVARAVLEFSSSGGLAQFRYCPEGDEDPPSN